MKFVNHGMRTAFLTEIRLKISSSLPDRRPILIVKEVRSVATFLIINDGWGPTRGCEFGFNLHPDHLSLPTDKDGNYSQPLAHFLALPDIETMTAVDVTQALLAEGVDLDQFKETGRAGNFFHVRERAGATIDVPEDELLRRYRAMWGKFSNGYARIVGQLSYRGLDLLDKVCAYTSPISVRVPLRVDWRVGRPRPP